MVAGARVAAGALASAVVCGVARADPPLPPLPAPAQGAAPPSPPSEPPPPPPPPPVAVAVALVPRPIAPAPRVDPTRKHAPAYSLWLGGGAGVISYGGGLYLDSLSPPAGSSGVETTGNFVTPGLSLNADVGARLAYRYIPYAVLELGLVGAGHRFEQTDTHALTSFAGFGFRYLAGDVDSVAFVGDISFGVRRFQVSNATGTWSASGLEILRLGLGADIRMSARWTLTPMLTLSGGSLTDTSGNITFGDGTHPLFTGNGGIPSANQTTYFGVVVGCSAHVDLFGK